MYLKCVIPYIQSSSNYLTFFLFILFHTNQKFHLLFFHLSINRIALFSYFSLILCLLIFFFLSVFIYENIFFCSSAMKLGSARWWTVHLCMGVVYCLAFVLIFFTFNFSYLFSFMTILDHRFYKYQIDHWMKNSLN